MLQLWWASRCDRARREPPQAEAAPRRVVRLRWRAWRPPAGHRRARRRRAHSTRKRPDPSGHVAAPAAHTLGALTVVRRQRQLASSVSVSGEFAVGSSARSCHQHGRRIGLLHAAAPSTRSCSSPCAGSARVAGIAVRGRRRTLPAEPSGWVGFASPAPAEPACSSARQSHGWRCVLGGVIQLERHDAYRASASRSRRECAPAARRGQAAGQMPASHRHLVGAAGELNVRGTAAACRRLRRPPESRASGPLRRHGQGAPSARPAARGGPAGGPHAGASGQERSRQERAHRLV